MSDFENDASAPKGVSRRTVAKAMAWSVPVVAVAATAPIVAASPPPEPPPPTFDWEKAYKNPGGSCDSPCVPKQSYGVPVLLTNPSQEDFQIQFTSYVLGGTDFGVYGITMGVGTTAAACVPLNTGCTPGCGDPHDPDYAVHSVCVPAGTLEPIRVYVTSVSKGNSANVDQRVDYRWVRKSDCVVTKADFGYSPDSPPVSIC
jgi:hypothetical protein